MKFKGLIFALIWMFAGSFVTFAHPLDISVSVIDVDSNDKRISISTYLHPFEVGVLLEKYGIQINAMSDAFTYKEKVFEYIQNSVEIKNNEQRCGFVSANIPKKDEFEIMGDGLEIQYQVECSNSLGILDFSNELFVEDFELQTNKIIFYENGDFSESIYEVVLTSKVVNDSFDYADPSESLNTAKDSDQDGLADLVEEQFYSTSIDLADTDFDGYTDKEEVDNGWDPLDVNPSPGQIQKKTVEESKDASFDYLMNSGRTSPIKKEVSEQESDNPPKILREKPAEETLKTSVIRDFTQNEEQVSAQKEIVVTSEDKPSNKSEISGSTFFKTDRLKKYLLMMKELFDSEGWVAKFIIFVLVFVLGVLHSIEAGHGKTILGSYLIEEKKTLRDASRFSAYLAVTHLLDVILLAVLFKVFSLVGDSYRYVATIQKIGAYLLLVMASFLLIRSVFPSLIKNPFKGKKGPVLAIIAGLAPCTFGWAILITTLSLNKINWLIPMIMVFGLGIYFSLMVFSIIVLKVKNRITQKSSKLARYSSVASASMLFVIAVVLIMNV